MKAELAKMRYFIGLKHEILAAMAALRDRQPVEGEPLMIEVLSVSC